jgi:hypothetical protein
MRRLRSLTPEEIGTAIDWAAREGWNPGLADAACFAAADPQGFLGAFDEQDRLLACISAIRTGAGQGFIGCYIAQPGARGRGHGWAVWQAGMARLAGRTIGLDGVVAQQANYRKSGFALAWTNARCSGAPPAMEAAPPPGLALAAAASLPFERLLAFDATAAGVARPDFLSAWLAAPGHVARALVAPDGAIAGLGVARPAQEGVKLGPLFAVDAAGARALFAALAAEAHARPLVLDVPEPNAAAVALAREAGLAKGFETARMYAGPPPPLALERVFGVTSFELG